MSIMKGWRCKMSDYVTTIRLAANLFPDYTEWDTNPEYLRGMCELIADMFMFVDGADTVRADIEAYLKGEEQ